MTVQINANQFSLKYIPDEDRMMFCVNMSAEHELGILLTRRLTRNLLDALMKHAPEMQAAPDAPAGEAPGNAQASGAAGGAQSQGAKESREEKPRALAFPPRLVREIKIATKDGGDIALVFHNGEQQLVLDVAVNRILTVIEIFLDLAGKAGWDFADLAARPKELPAGAPGETRSKVLH